MSIIHMDGFDSYASLGDLGMEYGVSGSNFSTSAGRFGGGAYGAGGYGQHINRSIANISEVWTGFAFQFLSGSSNGQSSILIFQSASGVEAELCYAPGVNTLAAYRGDLQASLGTVSWTPGPNYHWIEVHYKMSASVGIFEVWIDGVQVLNITGANTTQYGSSSFNVVALGNEYSGENMSCYYDDWYILDPNTSPNTARLGDSKIETLTPASDATPNNGTPSSGSSHFAMVDESQWSSANSLTLANTSGQEELFGMGTLSSTPANVWAVRVLGVAEKTDAGACNLEAVCVSGGTEADGPSVPLLTGYSHVSGIFQTDPNTSAEWTYSGVNAMKSGFKVP